MLLRTLSFGIVAVTPDWLRLDLVVRGASLTASPPNGSLRSLAEEFLRVLGLLPVIVGRREWIVGSDGAMLLRSLLVRLLLLAHGEAPLTGAKRLNEQLTQDERQLVETLPALAADEASIVGFHRAVAGVFTAIARPLVRDWPGDLERATREHLEREVGIKMV